LTVFVFLLPGRKTFLGHSLRRTLVQYKAIHRRNSTTSR